MTRRAFHTMLGLALTLGAATAGAGEIYQWKDANGVTHYSESPPPKGAYQQRTIANDGQAGVAPAPAAKAPAENPQCLTARKNIEALQGNLPVQQDTDGDGKPDRTLTDADRTNQLELARAAVKATCVAGTGATP